MKCPNCDYPLDTAKIACPGVFVVNVDEDGFITSIHWNYPVNGGPVEISCENCGYDIKKLIKDKNKVMYPCEW